MSWLLTVTLGPFFLGGCVGLLHVSIQTVLTWEIPPLREIILVTEWATVGFFLLATLAGVIR